MKKQETLLTQDGFSTHTCELTRRITEAEFRSCAARLYDLARGKHTGDTYPLSKSQKRGSSDANEKPETHFCKVFQKRGVRIYVHKVFIKGFMYAGITLILNPRRLIDSESSYLGTFVADEKSLMELSDQFTTIMREAGLPESLDDWQLSRCDLCVNVQTGRNRVARELNAALHKGRMPKKYKRALYTDQKSSAKELKKKNRHYLRYKTDSVTIVVYDKKFQMPEEGLHVDYDHCSNGILRAELQVERSFIRSFAKKHGIDKDDTAELLKALSGHSEELLLRYIRQIDPPGMHYKPEVLKAEIERLDVTAVTKEYMLDLAEQARRCRTLDKAIAKTAQNFDLSQKSVRILMESFEKNNISPIPLRQSYFRDSLPSLSVILKTLAEDGCTILEV